MSRGVVIYYKLGDYLLHDCNYTDEIETTMFKLNYVNYIFKRLKKTIYNKEK